jgi:hypothetical protein
LTGRRAVVIPAPSEPKALLQRDKIRQQFSLTGHDVLLRCKFRALRVEQIDEARGTGAVSLARQIRRADSGGLDLLQRRQMFALMTESRQAVVGILKGGED